MRSINFPLTNRRVARTVTMLATAAFILAIASGLRAQTPQLSLADLLIGLRSKKVTLEERNRILAEAVRQRGITFAINGEIETELSQTGADKDLLAAIKQRSEADKAAEKAAKKAESAKAEPAPAATPAPPDYNFYRSRADVAALKGDLAGALADYTRSLELKPDNAVVLFSRGQAHFNLRAFDKSVEDMTKALELNPNDSMTYANRGMAYEKLNELKKAESDFQKAVDLDSKNETAKVALKRVQDEQARLAAKAAEPAPTTTAAVKRVEETPPPPPARPEFLNIGTVGAANAVRMIMPQYPAVAARAKVEGKVTVALTINEEGDVIEAKATSGPSLLRSAAEDAAARTKFKPTMYEKLPITVKASITYNFSTRGN